jgi:DNA repair photolyase
MGRRFCRKGLNSGVLVAMALIEAERKSRVLTKSQFGCLRDVYTLNVTWGCEFMCVYCYARGYPGAPFSGEVYLYRNLPDKLAKELDNPRRRSVIHWVLFNTASDSFQTHPLVLDIAYRTMKVLLERGIGLSFLTKGWIPDRFIRLFSDYPGLIHSRIGLVSVCPRYRDLFEPSAATAGERLQNIDRLKEAGIGVEVRIDPIIPFYTDDEVSIKRLYEALAERDIKMVSLSYLHLRPAILDQLQRELPSTEFNVLRSCFESQSWSVVGTSTRSKLIPLPLRQKGYRRFMGFSKEFGITSLVCSCKNPDISSHQCSTGIGIKKISKGDGEKSRQLTLFSC